MKVFRELEAWVARRKSWVAGVILFILFFPLQLKMSLLRYFGQDELEHVHSTWHILQNHLPFTGFFQHHNPLLWYCMAPVVALTGEHASVMIVLRICMLAILMALIWFAGRMTFRLTGSNTAAYTTVLFMIGLNFFHESAMEIRPDGAQVLFCLLSIYAWNLYMEKKNDMYLLYSGIASGVAFLFLQKSVFILPVYAGLVAWNLWKGRMTLRQVVIFGLANAGPVLMFAIMLASKGMLAEYLLDGFGLNIYREHRFSFWELLAAEWLRDPVFWIASIPTLIYAIFGKKREEVKALGWFLFFQMLMIFYAPHAYRQYYLLGIVLQCILMGCIASEFLGRWQTGGIRIRLIWGTLVVAYSLYTYTNMWVHENTDRLQVIQYVLDHTEPQDALYDGNMKFNLFRPDLHYFWFNIAPHQGLASYQHLTGRYKDFDPVQLVKENKPKFISDFMLKIHQGTLGELYQPTIFEHVFMRADLQPKYSFPEPLPAHKADRRLTKNILQRYLVWTRVTQ